MPRERERDISSRDRRIHIESKLAVTMSDLRSNMVISDLLPVAPRVFLSSFVFLLGVLGVASHFQIKITGANGRGCNREDVVPRAFRN